MMKKYELTNETIWINGHTLHRIRALRDIEGTYVKAGDLGGFVESEANLSHEDSCWITGEACVYNKARVFGEARVYGDARVCGEACVYDKAHIYGVAHVYGKACVYDKARVYDKAHVYGEAHVCGKACVYGEAHVRGEARVYGGACVYGKARIFKPCNTTKSYISIGPIGSRDDIVTFLKWDGEIYVATGCFRGTLDEFFIVLIQHIRMIFMLLTM